MESNGYGKTVLTTLMAEAARNKTLVTVAEVDVSSTHFTAQAYISKDRVLAQSCQSKRKS